MLTIGLAASLILADASVPDAPPTFKQWGLEAVDVIRRDLYLPHSDLYADKMTDDRPSGPAFMWGCGVMLSALNGAAGADPAYVPWLVEYSRALERYWNEEGPVPGLDVLPTPKPVDRYYDDNAWVVIALAESTRILDDSGLDADAAHALDLAERTMAYVLSGEDDALGGGIYWRESDKASKNTCSNSPSAVAAYTLYERTGNAEYLAAGDRLLGWVLDRLQDPEDLLMWDNMRLDGSVEHTKWSYNTALTIRALLMAAEAGSRLGTTRELRGLARRMTDAAVERWVNRDTGGIRDGSAFAHLLVEALLIAGDSLGASRYREVAHRALVRLHDEARDSHGRYPNSWEAVTTEALAEWTLMGQAAAARALLIAQPIAPIR
ncbi:MAG: hypothetical protein GX134_02615 [candidate division WS1 bacterium]|jgi:uncharacterized protein YyaL (SSP411 family)|nr:hypothetical protein [candidate division WS1 bacterium]